MREQWRRQIQFGGKMSKHACENKFYIRALFFLHLPLPFFRLSWFMRAYLLIYLLSANTSTTSCMPYFNYYYLLK